MGPYTKALLVGLTALPALWAGFAASDGTPGRWTAAVLESQRTPAPAIASQTRDASSAQSTTVVDMRILLGAEGWGPMAEGAAFRSTDTVLAQLDLPADASGHAHVVIVDNESAAFTLLPGMERRETDIAKLGEVREGRRRIRLTWPRRDGSRATPSLRFSPPYGDARILATLTDAPLFDESQPVADDWDKLAPRIDAALAAQRARGHRIARTETTLRVEPVSEPAPQVSKTIEIVLDPPVNSDGIRFVLASASWGELPESATYRRDEVLEARLELPATVDGHLHVFLVGNDGKMIHLRPAPERSEDRLANLGTVRGGMRRIQLTWPIGGRRGPEPVIGFMAPYLGPYIVAVIADEPVFDNARPETESWDAFEPELKRRLTALREDGTLRFLHRKIAIAGE